RADEERVAEAGHGFEQHVPAAKQRDQGVLDDGRVADDDLADFRLEPGVGVAEGLDLGFGAHVLLKGFKLKVEGCRFLRFNVSWVFGRGSCWGSFPDYA